jgi:prepilin-type N-terminal cleavage/methylation domain-containing protein
MKTKKGFTLVEILAVLGVLAVILSFCLPALSHFSARLFLNASSRALASDLRNLQSQAILQHKTLSFDAGKMGLPAGIMLKTTADIRFCPSGFPPPGGSGTLLLQNRSGQSRKIIVSSAGRVRIE